MTTPVTDNVLDDSPADKAPGRFSATPDQLRLIDVAAALDGKKRGPFVVAAAVEKARALLAEKAPEALVHFPAA